MSKHLLSKSNIFLVRLLFAGILLSGIYAFTQGGGQKVLVRKKVPTKKPMTARPKKKMNTCFNVPINVEVGDAFYSKITPYSNDSIFRRVLLHDIHWDTIPNFMGLQYALKIDCKGKLVSATPMERTMLYAPDSTKPKALYRKVPLPEFYTDITTQVDQLFKMHKKWPVYEFKTDSGMMQRPYTTEVHYQYKIK